jgi:hypothetical protein
MHRSGTSALTGALALAGATPPRTLMVPNEHNPLGYWESEPLRQFHDRLLQAAGLEWDLWSRFDQDAIEPSISARFAAEFRRLFEQEFEAAPLVVIKDPRLCRLLPFWKEHLAAAGIEAVAVLLFRHPSEVAMSLQARDQLGREHAHLLWLRYLLDADQHTRTLPRLVVGYEDLLSNWRDVLRRLASDLGLEWSVDAVTAGGIDAFLRPGLRHHVAPPDAEGMNSVLAEWVTATHRAYDRLSQCGHARDSDACARLDAVRSAFDDATAPFDAVVPSERSRFRQRLGAATAELARLQDHAAAVDLERRRMAEHVAALDRQVARLTADSQVVVTERDDWRRRCLEARERVASLTSELEGTVARSTSAIADLSERAARAEHHVQALLNSLTWRGSAPLRALVGYLSRWQRPGR